MNSNVSSTASTATSAALVSDHRERELREGMCVTPSVAQPHVLVLRLCARIDLVLPLLLVAVEWRVGECRRVGLALIRALLVVDDLRTLAAAREHECHDGGADRKRCIAYADHDLVPPAGFAGSGAAGAGATLPGCVPPPAALGTLYAVAQPHTSPPLPRCVTRSR